MDIPSIPDRLEPVAPAEATRRHETPTDQSRRRDQNPIPRQVQDDDSDLLRDDNDSHDVDELA
jgi:hypothetical protein